MPPRNPIVQVLRGVELFRGLPALIVTEIARQATHLTYRSGEMLVCAGDMIEGAILIQEGQVISVSSSGNIPGDLLLPGSLINEMGMLVEIDSDATVFARTDVTALGLSREMIIALVEAEPKLAEHFNQKISARAARISSELRHIDEMLADLAEEQFPMSGEGSLVEPNEPRFLN